MPCIPEPCVATGCDGHRRRDVKDQGNGASMQHTSHIAQLPRNGEAEDGSRAVGIVAGRLMRDRLQLEYFVEDSIMALSKAVRATTLDS
jgi:hypothetical protein